MLRHLADGERRHSAAGDDIMKNVGRCMIYLLPPATQVTQVVFRDLYFGHLTPFSLSHATPVSPIGTSTGCQSSPYSFSSTSD